MRKSALYDSLAKRGCVYQARHGFERPGWFEGRATGVGALPLAYDFYGAYSEEDSGWRLGDEHADVPAHEGEHPYHAFINGELTFDWPRSFDQVCAALIPSRAASCARPRARPRA